jgi:FKBP-type peptidyl-prolyl cis-trans isomerase FkpA
MKKIHIFFLIFMLTACSRYPGYKKIGPDLYFRLVTFGENGRKAIPGDYITVDLRYATAGDSVFFRGIRKILLHRSPYPGAINDAFLRLSVNDSATIFLSALNFFSGTLNRDLPLFLDEKDDMRIDMRLLEVQTEKEFEQEKQKFLAWAEELNATEAKLIKKFINQQHLDVQQTSDGYYFMKLNEGYGRQVERGRHVTVQYEGRFLNGKYFDSTIKRNEAVDFIYGSEMILLPGLEKALGKMKEGEKALIILPSDLAFGASGSYGGIVPPWTALIYELEVLKVE